MGLSQIKTRALTGNGTAKITAFSTLISLYYTTQMNFFMITEMIRNRTSACTYKRFNANDQQRQFNPLEIHID